MVDFSAEDDAAAGPAWNSRRAASPTFTASGNRLLRQSQLGSYRNAKKCVPIRAIKVVHSLVLWAEGLRSNIIHYKSLA